MKISNLSFIIALLFLPGMYSCTEEERSVDLLRQAQETMDDDPAKSLTLLASIENPQNMAQDDYMQYLVASVHCKYQTQQDISSDTLIWLAQQYYESKEDPKPAASANYYSGLVYYENEIHGKALKSFLRSGDLALQNDDAALAGRSFNNVGYIYWDQDIVDSALVYYEKSYPLLQKGNGSDVPILKLLTNIGWVYKDLLNYDMAYDYWKKGLDLAAEVGNQKFQNDLKNNLGLILYDRKEYRKSIQYFHGALSKIADTQDSLMIQLNLSRTYLTINQPDSAQYYQDLAVNRLVEIEDLHILKYAYRTFSSYYKSVGDAEKALEYRDLKDAIDLRIREENKAKKLDEAKMQYYLEIKQKEMDSVNKHRWILSIVVLFIIIGLIYLSYRVLKILNLKYKKDLELAYLNMYPVVHKLQMDKEYYRNITVEFIRERKEMRRNKQRVRPISAAVKVLIEEQNRLDDLSRIENNIQKMTCKTRKELLKWAKSEVKNLPAVDDILENLADDDILLFSLCSKYYTREEIAIILNISVEEVQMCIDKLTTKMVEANKFTGRQISSMLTIDSD